MNLILSSKRFICFTQFQAKTTLVYSAQNPDGFYLEKDSFVVPSGKIILVKSSENLDGLDYILEKIVLAESTVLTSHLGINQTETRQDFFKKITLPI